MSRRPQTRSTTFAGGVTETRDAKTGELIGYTGLGVDPFVEAPVTLPTLAELGDIVSAARGGIECTADAYFVELAEEALRRAWAAGDASPNHRRDVDNVRFLAARAARQETKPATIHCVKCNIDSRLTFDATGFAFADNLGWRNVRNGEVMGPHCPDCMRRTTAFIEVPSKSNPSKPHKVVVENYKATRCDCDGFKYRKACSHMKQAAKMVGGSR